MNNLKYSFSEWKKYKVTQQTEVKRKGWKKNEINEYSTTLSSVTQLEQNSLQWIYIFNVKIQHHYS